MAEDDLEGKSGAGLKYSPEAGLGGGSDTAGKKSLWTSENLSGAKGHADASDRKSLCDDDVCGGEQDHGGTGVVTREGTFDSPRSPCAEGYKRTAPQESPAAEDERSPARESSYSDMSLGGSPPTNMAALAEEWETGSSRGDQRIGNGGEKRRWDDAERVRKRASLGGGRWMSGPLFDEPAPIYGEPRPFYDGLGAFCDDSGKVRSCNSKLTFVSFPSHLNVRMYDESAQDGFVGPFWVRPTTFFQTCQGFKKARD